MEELTRKPVTIYYNRGVADEQKREDAEAHPIPTGLNCAILFLEFNSCTLRLDIDDSIIALGFKMADGPITDTEVIADHIQPWIL